MDSSLPINRRAQISRLEFRIRNLRGKRRALFVRVGQATFEGNRAMAPVPQLAEDFQAARERAGALSEVEAEDAALAERSTKISRTARVAHSLAWVTEKGTQLAQGARTDLKIKGLVRDRNELLAKLGRGVAAKRDEVGDELVTRLLRRTDSLEEEIAAMEAESGALVSAAAAMDPRLRRRVYWIAGLIALVSLALMWWIFLGFIF